MYVQVSLSLFLRANMLANTLASFYCYSNWYSSVVAVAQVKWCSMFVIDLQAAVALAVLSYVRVSVME